jgi:Ca-activated chloride channel family protein
MLVRTFALWAALGVSVASAGAMLLPTPSARGGSLAVRPDPSGSQPTGSDAHFLDGKALLLDGRLGHASLPRDARGGTASTFLLATVTGADATSDDRPAPPPVHLAIVVDRSGSMAGPKMTNAVAAAVGAVDRMRDGDRATVVAFDTTARLVVPPTTVDGATRPSIEAAIRSVRAGGDTCISCALDRATEALDSSPGTRDEVRRVLLISDGEATTGIRDVGGLRRLAARARDRGFAVSTIGVDLAFDEKVMAAIAQESNGRHWFVPDPSALSQVFDEELGSLETAVASDAELTIEPAPGVIIDEVFDRSFRREGGRIVVPLGAFDMKQEKTILVSARVPVDADGTQPVARMSLGYRDVLARQDAHCSGSLAVDVRDDGTAQRDLDPFVAARVERSRTAHALLEANDLFSQGRATEARAELARRQSELALSAPRAVARAAALPPGTAGAPRDIGGDFGDQESALAHAQAGLGAAASASPAGAPPAASPAAKSALKSNQASATDLAF